jgi:hypothetical protein
MRFTLPHWVIESTFWICCVWFDRRSLSNHLVGGNFVHSSVSNMNILRSEVMDEAGKRGPSLTELLEWPILVAAGIMKVLGNK